MKALSWSLIVRFPKVDLAEGVDSNQSPDLHQGNHLDHQKTLKKKKKIIKKPNAFITGREGSIRKGFGSQFLLR